MSVDEKDCGCEPTWDGDYCGTTKYDCKFPQLAKDHADALETIERLEKILAEIDRVYGIKNVVTKEITGITLKDINLDDYPTDHGQDHGFDRVLTKEERTKIYEDGEKVKFPFDKEE